jgi:hypothetical protein
VKKKTIIRVVVALVLFCLVGRFGCIMVLSPSSHTSLQSPDKRFVVDISSRWCGDFWGGAAHDRHDIRIESLESKRVHRLLIDDRFDGWPQECSARWAADDSSVTLVFKREEMETMRLVLAVYK